MIVILEPSEQHIHSSVLCDICHYDQFTTSEDDTGAVTSVQLPNPFVSHGLKKKLLTKLTCLHTSCYGLHGYFGIAESSVFHAAISHVRRARFL